MFENYDDVLTVEEACEALKIGYNAMYELLNTGKIKGYRNGRVWRIIFSKSDICCLPCLLQYRQIQAELTHRQTLRTSAAEHRVLRRYQTAYRAKWPY